MGDRFAKPSILIVDDSPENLHLLKDILVDEYKVRPAINGKLALQLAAMDPQPDLILLDIEMPGMDGYEVCRQLKNSVSTKDIPIIFVTAKTGDENELEGLHLGAVDYITKPINAHILKARVHTHIVLRNLFYEKEEKTRQLYETKEQLATSLEEIAAAQERFVGLVQTIPDIVYKIDSKGMFTFLNKSVERLGYSQSDLIGKHFTEIIHIKDIEEASLDAIISRIGKGTAKPDQKAFDERRSGERMTVGLEIRLKTKTGKVAEVVEFKNIDPMTVNVEVNSTGLYGEVENLASNKNRQYIGTVGVIRDITDRQKAEKALVKEQMLLKQLVDTVPLPIFMVDGQGQLALSNKACNFSQTHSDKNFANSNLARELIEGSSTNVQEQITAFLNQDDGNLTKQQIEIISDDSARKNRKIILSKFINQYQNRPEIIGVVVGNNESDNHE
ncbi:MAG: response regulator [Magnetococcales bacterium]|nr:response regulator [Magnetococcales bacterium]